MRKMRYFQLIFSDSSINCSQSSESDKNVLTMYIAYYGKYQIEQDTNTCKNCVKCDISILCDMAAMLLDLELISRYMLIACTRFWQSI